MDTQNRGFDIEKQRAIERMRELNSRSKNIKREVENPSVQNIKPNHQENRISGGMLSQLNIPFLKDIGIDADISLILGLVLLLSAEKSDKLLILALVYILI